MKLTSLLHDIEHNPTQDKISNLLPQLFDEINYLILRIRVAVSFKDSLMLFDDLDRIQLIAAKLHYKYGFNLPVDLERFITDFNSLHDEHERERLFFAVKKGDYVYHERPDSVLFKVLDYMNQENDKTKTEILLHYLEKEIHRFNDLIRSCKQLDEAEKYFDVLLKIHETLSLLVFVNEIKVSDKLWQFIHDCERLDDPWLRKMLFDQITKGEYSL